MPSINQKVGVWVRQQVLAPRKLSISGAAKMLGVSRVTLSKVINGQSPLTPNVAARIENIFGVPAEALLSLQARADIKRQESTLDEQAFGFSYPFPVVKAHDLEVWADTIASRTELPVLIRRLIATTGSGIIQCDFPGYDNGEQHGWDGILETTQANPWVPEGLSVWELSTRSDIQSKANDDIQKRNKQCFNVEPSSATYIFVSLRGWQDKEKTKWLTEQKALKRWKDVRAYDAEDLERWLERSLEARIWLESRLSLPSQVQSGDIRLLDEAWNQWISSSEPTINESFFTEAVEEHQATLAAFLEGTQVNHLTIGAASVEEALAFLWCAMGTKSLSLVRERLLIFDKAETLQKMGQGRPTFIAVVHDHQTNDVCQTLNRRLKSIYIHSTRNNEADIELRPLSLSAVNRLPVADQDVSIAEGGVTLSMKELLMDCGASLTVLHRRLSCFQEQRAADWRRDGAKAALLIPASMMGQWSETSALQMQVLTQLVGTNRWDEFKACFNEYLKKLDAPVWRCEAHCGVVSKLDAFFSLRDELTTEVLDRFYQTTAAVLQRLDARANVTELAGLGVPIVSYDQWLVKTRHQLADTAAFLATYGSDLVKGRCPYNFFKKSADLMNAVLQPLSLEKLQQVGVELPVLAEIAPGGLLQLLEDDWTSNDSVIRCLLQTSTMSSDVLRDLLETMKVTAQLSEDNFIRTYQLLGQWQTFYATENGDSNDIARVLEVLFTPGSVVVIAPENLPKALQWVVKRFPEAGRILCLRLIALEDTLPEVLPTPLWKCSGRCEWTVEEKTVYRNKVGELLLSVTKLTTAELKELLPLLRVMPQTIQEACCGRLEMWQAQDPSDEALAELKEAMRQQVDFRRLPEGVRDRFEAVYRQLISQDIIQRNRWLFTKPWVEYAASEIQDEDLNWQVREKEVENQRVGTLKQILAERGTDGLLELAQYGEAQFEIGRLSSIEVTDEQWLVLLQSCLMLESNLKSEAMLQGLTLEVSSDRRQALSRWLASLTREAVLKLLMLMPFRRWVWQWMKIVVPQWADAYWKTVTPFYVKEKAEALEAVESLLSVNRPRAAFAVVQWQPRMVGAEVLQKILLALLKPSEDKSVVSGAHLKDGVKIVVQASDISRDIKAYIEFFYIDALRVHGSHRAEHIEALEAYITEHPEFYVNLIGWVFRRNDGKPDEAVYQNNAKTYGGISHRTLNAVCLRETLETEMSYENVRDWVNSVRRGCQAIGRDEVADILLGKLAVRSFYDPKTVQFPMNFYRLLTEVDSSEFIQGAMNELLNSRGLRWSSVEDSGDRERSMAEKIQQEMVRIRYEWPRGLELLSLFERQYMEEAEYHDIEGKLYRRSGSV